jgi:hypothetical protein
VPLFLMGLPETLGVEGHPIAEADSSDLPTSCKIRCMITPAMIPRK